jgi:glutamine amidotransferase
MIAVVDYGMGNLGSVKNALDYIGAPSFIARTAEDVKKSNAFILPGVGAFGDAMTNLEKRGLDGIIREEIGNGKPFLGICLGFQMLFAKSEETSGVRGLSVLNGEVLKFPGDMGLKIPQIGWNSITTGPDMPILSNFNGDYMYFVHSYYANTCKQDRIRYATCIYGMEFACAVEHENILALQFHPEKSGEKGMRLLSMWKEEIK